MYIPCPVSFPGPASSACSEKGTPRALFHFHNHRQNLRNDGCSKHLLNNMEEICEVLFFFTHMWVVYECVHMRGHVSVHTCLGGGPRLMSSILLNSSSPLYTEAESLTWICSWCTGLVWTVISLALEIPCLPLECRVTGLAFMWVLGIWSSSLHSKSQLFNHSSLVTKWKFLFV